MTATRRATVLGTIPLLALVLDRSSAWVREGDGRSHAARRVVLTRMSDRRAGHPSEVVSQGRQFMTRQHAARGTVAVTVGVMLSLAVSAGIRIAEAQSQSQGAVLAGTWFIPGTVLTAFFNYHQDGTMDGMRSHEFGGPPRPGEDRSNVRGFWRQMGSQFEAVTYNYRYDGTTGDALAIVRLRWVFSFDPGFESTSGEFFVTQWFCPTGLSCPNPLVSVPDIAEFPGGPFTQVRLRH